MASINLFKWSSYSILASIFGTGVAFPTVGCLDLIKKNKENDELLKNKKIELDKAEKEIEDFKNKTVQSFSTLSEARKQA